MNEPPAPPPPPPDAFWGTLAKGGHFVFDEAPAPAFAPRRLETSTVPSTLRVRVATSTSGRVPRAVMPATVMSSPTMKQASGWPAAIQLAGCVDMHELSAAV